MVLLPRPASRLRAPVFPAWRPPWASPLYCRRSRGLEPMDPLQLMCWEES